jgi:hypothetical protein
MVRAVTPTSRAKMPATLIAWNRPPRLLMMSWEVWLRGGIRPKLKVL